MGLLKRTRARWIDSGENRQVKWKNVRRALLLASVSLSVTLAGIVGWVAQNQREDYENKVAFCHVREDASTELSTFARSVRDFAIGVRDITAAANPDNPNVVRLTALSSNLAAAANAYQPVTFEECMAATAAP
jgi:hypothetical protein